MELDKLGWVTGESGGTPDVAANRRIERCTISRLELQRPAQFKRMIRCLFRERVKLESTSVALLQCPPDERYSSILNVQIQF